MEEKSFTHGVTLHKDGTYALQLNIDFGYMTPDDLITLGEIAKKYGGYFFMSALLCDVQDQGHRYFRDAKRLERVSRRQCRR